MQITAVPGPEDDATTNTSQIVTEPIESEASAGDQAPRDAIVAQGRDDFAAFGLDERPVAGDYTMAVITPTNFFGPSVGIVDCGDENPNNIVFAVEGSPLANAVSGRVGVTLGLVNMDEPSDIMGMPFPGGAASFIDACVAVSSTSGACPEAARSCPDGEQNAVAQLLAILGPA